MDTLFVDIEAFSSAHLLKGGAYRYIESPDFEVLLFGYSVDGAAVQVVDLARGKRLPEDVLAALTDSRVVKWAHNAAFERVVLSPYLGLPPGQYLDPRQWRCSMIWSAYMGLPLSLEAVGAVLNLPEQKLREGRSLVRYFCYPCLPTKTNGGRERNLPAHAPDRWERFIAYNRRDVEAEMQICAKLAKHPVPEAIWAEYVLDQEINDRGIAIDRTLVKAAMAMDEYAKEKLIGQMRQLTGMDNPNSVMQMKRWLADNGLEMDTLGKKAVADLLKTAPEPFGEVLKLRLDLAKSSVAKYAAMEKCWCADARARGMFQFYGASRSGRWAGRRIQLQNLARNDMDTIDEARALVRSGDMAALELLYDSTSDVLSQLVRTAFVPAPGKQFIVVDFASIEARVLAWLAGEKWVLDVFRSHGKIYEATAAQMFHIPIETITKGSPLRQKGKIAALALGYGGSVGALKNMGALDMGLSEEELPTLVAAWREANPHITAFWRAVDRATLHVVTERTRCSTHGITFECKSQMLFITLPSGRKLAYVKPRIGLNRFGRECLSYEGVNLAHQWGRIESYGAKVVENIVQATARDLLMHAMFSIDRVGYPIVAHVHDEVIVEAPLDARVEDVAVLMCDAPVWAEGLPLRAEGYACDFYKKA
jgi:DNA polymerase